MTLSLSILKVAEWKYIIRVISYDMLILLNPNTYQKSLLTINFIPPNNIYRFTDVFFQWLQFIIWLKYSTKRKRLLFGDVLFLMNKYDVPTLFLFFAAAQLFKFNLYANWIP